MSIPASKPGTTLKPGPELPARRKRSSAEREGKLWDEWPFGEMSPAAIARLMHTSVVSARRWRRAHSLPKILRPLARLMLWGDLSIIDPAWEGWSLYRGEIHSPWYTRPFSVADMEYFSFTVSRLSTAEARISHLEAENERLRQALSEEAAARAKLRAEQRLKLKTIGGAELLFTMAKALRDTMEREGTLTLDAQVSMLAISRMVMSLYQEKDPGTGEPYFTNGAANDPPPVGEVPPLAIEHEEPPSAA